TALRPPRPPLFPYTTLFRSRLWRGCRFPQGHNGTGSLQRGPPFLPPAAPVGRERVTETLNRSIRGGPAKSCYTWKDSSREKGVMMRLCRQDPWERHRQERARRAAVLSKKWHTPAGLSPPAPPPGGRARATQCCKCRPRPRP